MSIRARSGQDVGPSTDGSSTLCASVAYTMTLCAFVGEVRHLKDSCILKPFFICRRVRRIAKSDC